MALLPHPNLIVDGLTGKLKDSSKRIDFGQGFAQVVRVGDMRQWTHSIKMAFADSSAKFYETEGFLTALGAEQTFLIDWPHTGEVHIYRVKPSTLIVNLRKLQLSFDAIEAINI